MKHMRNCAVAALALAMAACSGDSGGSMGPVIPQVAGTWTYSATNIAGSGASCSVTGLTLTVNQTAETFTGSYSGGSMTCSGNGESATLGPFQGTIVSGSISGNSVSFDLDTQDWRNTGTINGSSMSGTVTVRFDLGSGPITLSGNWSAAR